jgi:two-component system, OmpR family, copper resistance phosphate regulon response regulator CusR
MRILVIEDEPRILGFLRLGLEAEGFSVDGAVDGATGLSLALSGPYELVVLDLQLPRLDGLRLLEEVHGQRPGLPVLILSARDDVPTKLRGFELGAIDYMAKPFSFDELVARVRVHLRSRRDDGDGLSTISVGALTLDLARRRAIVGDRAAELSDREFKLLYHLAAHAGEVISRERLLSEVWGYSFDPGSNVVDVCVRRLRSKLGFDLIKTVRGSGYRLAC